MAKKSKTEEQQALDATAKRLHDATVAARRADLQHPEQPHGPRSAYRFDIHLARDGHDQSACGKSVSRSDQCVAPLDHPAFCPECLKLRAAGKLVSHQVGPVMAKHAA